MHTSVIKGFSYSSVSKESACNAGDLGSIPGWGISPEEGNGNPHQYSCLENPKDREAWLTTVHGVTRVGYDLVPKPPLPRISRDLSRRVFGLESYCFRLYVLRLAG